MPSDREIVLQAITDLIATHGAESCMKWQWLEGMLRDRCCGQCQLEINVLICAARAGVVSALIQTDEADLDRQLVGRLVRQLADNFELKVEFSEWAVRSWAVALGRQAPPVTQTPAGQETVNPRDGAVMVYVPAGEFLMGSDDGNNDEKPQRCVYLDDFWMYKHPVTWLQYVKFCTETLRQKPNGYKLGRNDQHPAVNVSWDDAVSYARWNGVRLPTEAEWEKASRGTDGRTWPWGSQWDAKRCHTGFKWGTSPVTAHPQGASPYGCLDMAGNVYEWCADWYDSNYYRNATERNPTGPANGDSRVVRGGSWVNNSGNVRCAYRCFLSPDLALFIFGFRCARTP